MAELAAYRRKDARNAAREAGSNRYTVNGVIRSAKNENKGAIIGKGGPDTVVPTRKTPSVISNANIVENRIPEMNAKVSTLPVYTPTNEQEQDQEQNIDDFFGFNSETTKKGKGTSSTTSSFEETEDPYTDKMFSIFDEMKKTSDRYTRDQIALAESQAKRQRAQAQSAIGNATQNVRTAILGAGGGRSGSGISAVLQPQLAGVETLAAIDAQERAAVSEARMAQQNGDYKLLEQKLGLLENIRKDKSAAFEEIQQAGVQAERDNQIAELISQGITDPVEMLQTLNADGGDFTLAEITGSLKGLNEIIGKAKPGTFKFEDKQIGPLLGAGFTQPEIQDLQAAIAAGVSVDEALALMTPEEQTAFKTALGLKSDAGAVPGVGAQTPLDEQMIRTRLFPKAAAILNKGALSDADREIIDERIAYFRGQGLSEQQILDVFSGWSQDVVSPYNNAFRDIIITNDKDGQGVSPTLSRVGSLLASGNYKGAMKAVEQTAMLRAKELDPDGYMGDAPTEVYTKRIDRIKQFLAAHSDYGNTGFIEGNFNKVLGKLKGADSAKLKAELTQLYQTFRKENAGSAVTDSEQRFLNQLFADIDDPKGNFIEKLDAFQKGIIDRHNATRNSVSLPPVRVLEVLDPNERLNLYGSSTARSSESNDAGI